jgi:hypothetical protein
VPSEARKRFLNEVKAAVRASARRELIVFVHGYNVNFEACMKSAAQVWCTYECSSQHGLTSSVELVHSWIHARNAQHKLYGSLQPCPIAGCTNLLTGAVCATTMLKRAVSAILSLECQGCTCYWLAAPLL